MNTQEQKTILLVEDEALIAMDETQTIKGFGYQVITANSGEKAVETALSNEKISLILMDIDLGKGIDGPEAARQILVKKHIPIVFLTSHSEKEYVDRVKQITRYGYVLKNSGDFVLWSSIEIAYELFEANENLRLKIDELWVSHHFLEIATRHTQIKPLIKEFVVEIKKLTGCAAIGKRLLDRDGNIPYEAYEGFSKEFYELESPLSIKSDQCMCINVIKGRTDQIQHSGPLNN